MNNKTKEKKLRKSLAVANIINTVFTVQLCLAGILARIGIKQCEASAAEMMDKVQTADPESYMGGYQALGGLLGSGAAAITIAVLYLFIIVLSFYLVMFLLDNMKGYRIASRLKKESYSDSLVKRVRGNAIYKIVLALLVAIPGICFAYSIQWFAILIVIVPQGVVAALAISILRMLPDSSELFEPRISMKE